MNRHTSACLLPLVLVACAATAWGASAIREPHIGYVYPAGGQRGQVLEVLVGGQFLQGVSQVHVSGQGVRATAVKHYRPPRNINGDQRQDLQRRVEDVRDKRLAELRKEGQTPVIPGRMSANARKRAAEKTDPVKLPDHPLLDDLENKSLRELQHIVNELLDWRNLRKRQPNTQLGEMVRVRVTIDPDAEPGDRELRLGTPLGLTNPLCFQVGTLPEVREQEPDDPVKFAYLPKVAPVDLPAVLNGQIMPGDVDRFRFRARRGQHLVIQASARRLVPFLADAVPGWFQATVALYDAHGREMASVDDYRFDPDPVLMYEVPEDGEYELQVRDAIYRGREDFVYRIAIGELPFITEAFPLGGQAGVGTLAAIDGWNLPKRELWLNTRPGPDTVRHTALRAGRHVSNEVVYAVDDLPECAETEPNDDPHHAQRIDLPAVVNGRIVRSGDVDVYQFEGHAGDEVVAETLARRLCSPLDSLLRITDASGDVLEWNDDHMETEGYLHPDMGCLTHHADSYLRARLPGDGTYYVQIADAQDHGGHDYGYRLRISPPQPDFELRVTPSGLGMFGGSTAAITVHALRRDGFDGEIELALKGAPRGFVLTGGRIPAGCSSMRMTLTAPQIRQIQPIALELEGRAVIKGETVVRVAVPSDDSMQAFLWRHLVPAQEFLVTVRKTRWDRPAMKLAGDGPIQVPVGGTADVVVKTPKRPNIRKVDLRLQEPPDGITLQNVRIVPEGLAFELTADGDSLKPGFADNLIADLVVDVAITRKTEDGAKPTTQVRQFRFGVLPAIPFVVVQP